ncbi:PAP2-domain-containing protein [Pisolithus orientalis]|uniref:PAP2-domain-containing protein n=1 Tax=Pisolithus orientalis TaxID=936130 RepID=UPI0022248415|nr:PAP2-domain-containing protein [Pisolithus orientalis]KAI6028622.1 PAP2-domain-containing protein [Pisolithus orientalis]
MAAFPTYFNTRTAKKTDNKRRLQLLKSYGPDWIITIALAAVFFALDNVHGYRREFSVNDETLRFPYAVHERVPNWALYIIALVAPIIIHSLVNVVTIRSFWDFHNSVLGLILGLAITGAITQFSKITTGRPRPDLLSRCIPRPGSQDPTYGLSSDAICTQTDQYIMIDGWRSFPSGHSSLSFAGLGFLSFYLAGKMHLFDKRGHAHKAWISLAPLSGATLVAISRTMDYRHHWHDVVAGAILGTTIAYFTYRQYFPSLASPMSHRPYSPRVPRDEEILPTAASHGGPRYSENDEGAEQVELIDGGVRKPDPGPLEDIWRHGGDSTRDDAEHS